MCEFDWIYAIGAIIALLVVLIPLLITLFQDEDGNGCGGAIVLSIITWVITYLLLVIVLGFGCRFILFIWHAMQTGFLTIWPFIESNLIFIIFSIVIMTLGIIKFIIWITK